MKRIAILVTAQTNMASMDNPRRAFLFVNELLGKKGVSPLFDLKIAGTKKNILLENGWYTLHPDMTYQEMGDTDLIIIPAFDGDLKEVILHNKSVLPWLAGQYREGTEIASLCVGAFLLAATGLLNGKTCSTHWRAAETFKEVFPDVCLQTEKIITDQDGLYTSGGAFSSANLILYLIEKYAGRVMAIQCAKMFQVDIDRKSQSPFMIFKGQKNHKDKRIEEAQQYIEEHYQEKITVNQLCKEVALSRRSFERRFKHATDNTIMEYIQRVKIEAAKKCLETTRMTVSELMYEVGYTDTKSFRNVFRKLTGLSPIEYRQKFQKSVV